LLIHSASQLITLAGGPQRGSTLGHLEIIRDGAVLIHGNEIRAVGNSKDLLKEFPHEPTLDAGGKVVMPGFIDSHTHLVWAGDRAGEFDLRLQGKSYQEILAAGGGILSTVRATRKATKSKLLEETRQRASDIFLYGTTTVEAKSGYGLEWTSEIRQLETLLSLDEAGPLEIIPTFLAAHAIPPEYQPNPEGYVDLICGSMLPDLAAWWHVQAPLRNLPFVDVFCDQGAFNLDQTRRILETARSLDFPLKIHADEFENLGGTCLAVELGAVSADHLVKTSPADIEQLAASNTVAVSLPCTPFGLAESHYSPVRELLNAGGLLAIASDFNPGTAWCGNMQFVIALACRYLKLTPAEAIAAATINAAAAVQRQDRIGSIEPGKQADLIFLSVEDYHHLGYRFGPNLVTRVIKNGKVYPNLS
jgi:imidazolonepropionase